MHPPFKTTLLTGITAANGTDQARTENRRTGEKQSQYTKDHFQLQRD